MRYTFNIQDSITATENTPDSGTDGVFASTIRYNYKYDGLNRLYHATGFYEKTSSFGTTETQKFELGYAYAANGNLTQKNIIDPDSHAVQDSWNYIYSNHAATGISTTVSGSRFTMQYDLSGNMIMQHDTEKSLTKQMSYDSNNRIKNVVNPATGETAGEYWYDDQGFRVRKISRRVENGEAMDNELLYPCMYMGMELQLNSDGTNAYGAINNIYMNGLRVAALAPEGNSMYFLTDQVDSVKVVTDDSGKAVSRMEYLPYGETWFQEGEEDFAPKFNSQELDKESGFFFYNARYYDPEICRFVTADNLINGEFDTQAWNRYSYVKNNPIIYKDPTGHEDKPYYNKEKMSDEQKQALINSISENSEIVGLGGGDMSERISIKEIDKRNNGKTAPFKSQKVFLAFQYTPEDKKQLKKEFKLNDEEIKSKEESMEISMNQELMLGKTDSKYKLIGPKLVIEEKRDDSIIGKLKSLSGKLSKSDKESEYVNVYSPKDKENNKNIDVELNKLSESDYNCKKINKSLVNDYVDDKKNYMIENLKEKTIDYRGVKQYTGVRN